MIDSKREFFQVFLFFISMIILIVLFLVALDGCIKLRDRKVEFFVNNEVFVYYPEICVTSNNSVRMRMKDGSEMYLYGFIRITEIIKDKKDNQ